MAHLSHKLALTVCSSLLAVGCLEVAARLYARLSGQDRVIVHDSLLGWKLVAGAHHRYVSEEKPYVVDINSRGLRDREYPYERPTGRFRILFLGDSFVFGSAADGTELFTERLESSVPRLEVINAGVPGYSLDQELLYLESEGYRYQPNLVVLGVFRNDFAETFLPYNPSIRRWKGYAALEGGELRLHAPSFGVLFRMVESSYLLSWARQRVQVNAQDGEAVQPPDPATQREAFRRLLIRMRDVATASGAEFAAMYIPSKSQNTRHTLQEILDDLSRQERVPVLDLEASLEPSVNPEKFYFKQDIHLNARGHARTAELLQQFLVERTSLGRHVRTSPTH
jgi:lysophospholipase L1-like esterase